MEKEYLISEESFDREGLNHSIKFSCINSNKQSLTNPFFKGKALFSNSDNTLPESHNHFLFNNEEGKNLKHSFNSQIFDNDKISKKANKLPHSTFKRPNYDEDNEESNEERQIQKNQKSRMKNYYEYFYTKYDLPESMRKDFDKILKVDSTVIHTF